MSRSRQHWLPRLLSLALALALSACGGSEFAYKSGAGADQLAQAKKECAKAGGPYEACMQSKGWTVHQLDDDNPLAVIVPTTNGDRSSPERVYVAADKPTNTPLASTAAAATIAATTTGSSGTAAPITPIAGSAAETAKAIPNNGKKAPPDPLTKFKVSSWWKMGGGAADLKTAMAACVDKLGPAHQPDMQQQIMTRALILCLKEQGWYGLQGY